VKIGSTAAGSPVSPELELEPRPDPPPLEVLAASWLVPLSLAAETAPLLAPSVVGSAEASSVAAVPRPTVPEPSGAASAEPGLVADGSAPQPQAIAHAHATTRPRRPTPLALAEPRKFGKRRPVRPAEAAARGGGERSVAALLRCAAMSEPLTPIEEGVWVVARPHRFFGVHLGTRMTVIRLANGEVVLHSPVAIDDELRAALADLGPVRHVIAPNYYHHVYVADALAAFPEAALHGSADLARKRKDLTFTSHLGDDPIPGIGEALLPVHIRGSLLRETVFYHPRTRTLVGTDLLENFRTSEHWFTRMYLKVSGVHGRPGVGRLLRPMFRERAQARQDLERILDFDFRRITICHGDLVEQDAHDVLRQSYAWL
jgi:hypothetical protein